jgi:hypothetical protein
MGSVVGWTIVLAVLGICMAVAGRKLYRWWHSD